MNKSAQRIAIAEKVLGWKFSHVDRYGCSWHLKPDGDKVFSFKVPKYDEDLNAAFGLVEVLRMEYAILITAEKDSFTVDAYRGKEFVIGVRSQSATAAIAELFLRLNALWTDEQGGVS